MEIAQVAAEIRFLVMACEAAFSIVSLKSFSYPTVRHHLKNSAPPCPCSLSFPSHLNIQSRALYLSILERQKLRLSFTLCRYSNAYSVRKCQRPAPIMLCSCPYIDRTILYESFISEGSMSCSRSHRFLATLPEGLVWHCL